MKIVHATHPLNMFMDALESVMASISVTTYRPINRMIHAIATTLFIFFIYG